MIERHESMRGWFAYELREQMRQKPDVWLVTGDLGYKMFDHIREEFPDRFINCGASEQAMVGVAVGLALEGRTPVVYSITPFLLYRPFETIRNYLHHEGIPVKLVGSGRDRDYAHDGYSHWAEEDRQFMKMLSGIEARWPDYKEDLPVLIEEMLITKKPYYLNLKR